MFKVAGVQSRNIGIFSRWPLTWKNSKSGKLRVVRENRKSQGKCVLACQLVLRKIVEIVATDVRCQAKTHQIRFRLGLRPRPRWGSSAPPDPLAGFKGTTSKRGEGRNSELFRWSLLKNTVVIVVTVYRSIAVINNRHFVLYRYCCEARYSVNIHLKCLEKSGNLIMTGDWPPCILYFTEDM